jgi:hypothetical protein
MGRRSVSEGLRNLLPEYAVEIRIDVHVEHLHVPDLVAIADGFTDNREYWPILDLGWHRAEEIAEFEMQLLNDIASSADTAEFDTLAAELEEEAGIELEGLELGAAGAVTALVAAGCVTCFSCRGHAGTNLPHPQIRFAVDRTRVKLIVDAARESRCGIESDAEGLVWIVSPSLVGMLAFADEIRVRSGSFDGLPKPLWNRRP